MATITLNFNQANADRMEAAFTEFLQRPATGDDIKAYAIGVIADLVRNVERDLAERARNTSDSPVDIT